MSRDGAEFMVGVVLVIAGILGTAAWIGDTTEVTPIPAVVRGVPECHVMGGMVEWNLAKTEQVNRLLCIGVDDDYPYTIRVSRDEWEKWTQTLGNRWPGD